MRTANPTFNQETKVRVDAGSAATKNVAIAHNQPLVDDTLAIRVAGEYLQRDGWVENPTRNEKNYDAHSLANARIKALYKPTEDLEAVLGFNYTKNEAGEDFVNYQKWKEDGDRYNYSDHEADEGAEHFVTSLDINYQLNPEWKIFSKTGVYATDYTRIEDDDNTAQPQGYIDRKAFGNSFSQELKAGYRSQRMSGTFGVFYTQIDSRMDTKANDVPGDRARPKAPPEGLLGLQTVLDYHYDSETRTDNKAVFGEFQYDFMSGVSVLLGARYDMENKKFKSSTKPKFTDMGLLTPQQVAGLEAQATSNQEFDSDYNAFLPKASLVYNFNDRQNLGLTYQQGYRAGGAGLNGLTQKTYQYDPEYTTNYELAWRSTSRDSRTVFNANVYYTDWRDMQVNVYAPGSTSNFIVDNSGSSELYGTELTLSHEFNDDFNMLFSASYNKTEFKDYVSEGRDYSGNSFVFAPENMLKVAAQYFVTDNWVVSGDANYQSESYGDANNIDAHKIPGRTLFNMKAGYESDDWSAYIYSRNLTNEDYATQFAVDANNERERVRLGEPRFIGVQLNANF